MNGKKIIATLLCILIFAMQMPVTVLAEGQENNVPEQENDISQPENDPDQSDILSQEEDSQEFTSVQQAPCLADSNEGDTGSETDDILTSDTEGGTTWDPTMWNLAGKGTDDDPYLISSDENWVTFVNGIKYEEDHESWGTTRYYSSAYKLTSDITVNTLWPEGDKYNLCKSTFDGDGHTITLDLTGGSNVSLFPYVCGETIKNLNVTGTIYASGQFASGLVSHTVYDGASPNNSKVTITNCHVDVTINSTVSGDGTHGGLVAVASRWSGVDISDSSFTGKLLGPSTNSCGGIVGYIDYESYMDNVVFAPKEITVSSQNSKTIARVSSNNNLRLGNNVYYLTNMGDAQGKMAYDTPITSDFMFLRSIGSTEFYTVGYAMLSAEGAPYAYNKGAEISVTPRVTFLGEDIDPDCYTSSLMDSSDQVITSVTEIGEYKLSVTGVSEKGYYGTLTVPFKVVKGLDGDGSEEYPYLIHSIEDWSIFADKIANGTDTDKYYKLADDYDESSIITVSVGSSDHPFAGHFDGNNKTLTVNIEDTSAQGTALFRYIAGATISDLKVSGSVKGSTHAAGLVGFNYSGESTITDCIVSTTVTGGSHIGGIVGHGKSATLNMERCVFNGVLETATDKAAGIVGWMDNATINLASCLFSGTNNVSGQFHPIALRSGGCNVQKTISDCYYLTDPTTTTGDNVLGSAIGMKVTSEEPEAGTGLYKTITAADNNDYYLVMGNLKGLQKDYYSTNGLELVYTVSSALGEVLTEGTDYEVSYTRDGEPVSAVSSTGNYIISITGKGVFSGSESYEFTVHETVKYLDYDVATGDFIEKEAPSSIVKIDGSTVNWDKEWYVVEGSVTIGRRITVGGPGVHLILTDRSSLTANRGITVAVNKNLAIYSQSTGDTAGSLTAYARDYGYAAIGGFNSPINAGSDESNYQTYGNITINGGRINADAYIHSNGYNTNAGIGGGRWDSGVGGSRQGTVTINGGDVTARGYMGAGIGGGLNTHSGVITIRGGKVNASSRNASGIGDGTGNIELHADIHISWTRTSVDSGMSIKSNNYGGSLKFDSCFVIEGSTDNVYYGTADDSVKSSISGKTLVPFNGYKVTYRPGQGGEGEDITSYEDAGEYILKPLSTYKAPAGNEFIGWDTGDAVYEAGSVYKLTGNVTFTAVWGIPVIPYVDAKGNDMDPKSCYPISSDTTELTQDGPTAGWYAVTRDIEIDSRITTRGNINLILADGATLTVPAGISVTGDNSLTIWGQKEGNGSILILDPNYNAGIGGDRSDSTAVPCGDVTINGGTITVKAYSGAGIGGGFDSSDANSVVTINGGNINITVPQNGGGAAIGGGYQGYLGMIKITGGTVNAISGDGEGIGTGFSELDDIGCTIAISGGNITCSSIGGRHTTVSLDWNEPIMSIKSGAYKGTITMAKPFKNSETGDTYPAGNVTDNTSIAGVKLIPAADLCIAGHSLTLDGRIGVNFFVYIPEEEEIGTMSFAISGKGNIETASGYTRKDGYYVYTCYINSIQMADTITASYKVNGEELLSEEYSVEQYLQYFDTQKDLDSKMIALVHALGDYGHYAQRFLSAQNGWNIGTDYKGLDTVYTDSYDIDAVLSEIGDYTASVEGSGVTASFALKLDSATELDIYLSSDSEITLTDCPYPVSVSDDGRTVIKVKNIASTNMDKTITITGNAGGSFSITLSPLSYIRARLNAADVNNVHNAMAAMYYYYKTSKAYIGG